MKYRDWNEMQRKLEALYVLDNALTDPSEEYLRLSGSMPGFRRNIRISFHQRKKEKRLFSFGMMENYIKIPSRKMMVGSGC